MTSESASGPEVPEAVEEVVEDAVDEAVAARLDDVAGQTREAAATAQSSAASAQDSATRAQQAQTGAQDAGAAAVEAASVVAPDDPLLDTAVRKLDAQVSEEQPFGRPGRPLSSRSPFRVAFTASLGVAVAYGLVQALIVVRPVLILLLISAFLAIGLDPAVNFLERHRLSRTQAVSTVLLAVLAFFALVGLAVIPPVVDQVGQLIDSAPDYIQQLQDNPRIAELDARYGLLDRAQAFVDQPEKVGFSLLGGVVGAGKVVFSTFFSSLTVLILTLYFLSSLPTIKANAYRLIPRSRRSRVGLLTDEILGRVGGYVAGAVSIALIAGASTFVVLEIAGVPYPLALAVLVAITDLVPLIGATIGAAIVTLVAFFVSVRVGIGIAIFYLVYQQLENYLLYPRIMKRSVDVSPAATVVAVLIGGSLLGVLGALLAIPIAAAIQLVLQQVVAPRQDAA